MSLMQFEGEVGRAGVNLEFVIDNGLSCLFEENGLPKVDFSRPYPEQVPCEKCGKSHPQIYTAWRKPRGMFGCWVVFRYLGEEHVPDLSIPISVPRVPRGATKVSAERNAELWHR